MGMGSPPLGLVLQSVYAKDEGVGFIVLTLGPWWSHTGQHSPRLPLGLPHCSEKGYLAGDGWAIPLPAHAPLMESYLQGTRSQNRSRVVGKESMHGGGQAPRTGPKPQGSRGLSLYGQFALVASLLVREPGPGGRNQLLL